MKSILPKDYGILLVDIKQRIRSAQYDALKAVNKELISFYWDIGRMIVERQEGDSWGKSIVERLALDLQTEFAGVGGFSSRNIWNMRNFFMTYSQNPFLQPLVAEISWSHNLVIMEQCKDPQEREFYIRMTKNLEDQAGRSGSFGGDSDWAIYQFRKVLNLGRKCTASE